MKQRYTFHEPGCRDCKFFVLKGIGRFEARYCYGFPRKSPKRFRVADPKINAPSWCPRRLKPAALRIYGFVDEQSRWAELIWTLNREKPEPDWIHPISRRYKLRMEMTTSKTAKQFFEGVNKHGYDKELLKQVEQGEIIEIDNGLEPHYFFCYSSSRLIPVFDFDKNANQPPQETRMARKGKK